MREWTYISFKKLCLFCTEQYDVSGRKSAYMVLWVKKLSSALWEYYLCVAYIFIIHETITIKSLFLLIILKYLFLIEICENDVFRLSRELNLVVVIIHDYRQNL